MDFVNGRPYPFPFDERGVMTDNDIIEIHNQLVGATAQLASLCFDRVGMLRFDKSKLDSIRIGSIIDRKGRCRGPFENSKEYIAILARIVHEGERDAEALTEHLETALLHGHAAQYAAHADFLKGPFPLKHNDFRWQNMPLNAKCELVGIIDWEWAHTVSIESCTVLPFNLAGYVRPKYSRPVHQVEDRAVRLFCDKLPDSAANKVQDTRKRPIRACLDRYNWADVRETHTDFLKELVAYSASKGF